LEKDNPLHLNNLESPPPNDDLCWPSVVKIGPVVLEKKSNMLKFIDGQTYRQTDRRTDGKKDGLRKKCDQKRSLEPSAQVS
jgi:hypothetical protein